MYYSSKNRLSKKIEMVDSNLDGLNNFQLYDDFNNLSKLIIGLKLIKETKDNDILENQIIKSIIDINDEISTLTSLKLGSIQLNKFIYKLTVCLIQLQQLSTLSNELNCIITNNIRDEINFKIDTFQVGSIASNQENEIKAIELNEMGNNEYSIGNIEQSGKLYKEALNLDSLSSLTKSKLYSNLSFIQFIQHHGYSKHLTPTSIIPELDDYDLLVDAEQNSIKGIVNRPSCYRPYLVLAKIKSRLSNYQTAIDLCDAATLLLLFESSSTPTTNTTTNLSVPIPSLKTSSSSIQHNSTLLLAEIEKVKRNAIERLKMKNAGVFIGSEGDEKRNYNNESTYRLEQLGNLIPNLYKDKITPELLVKHGLIDYLESAKKVATIYGVSTVIILERLANTKIIEYLEQTNYKNAIELLGASIVSNSPYSDAYTNLAECLRCDGGGTGKHIGPSTIRESDRSLYLSLLLKATLVDPIIQTPRRPGTQKSGSGQLTKKFSGTFEDLENMITNNYGYVLACYSLASIYRHGSLGEDIDIEKAIYYYNQSIKYDNQSDYTLNNCQGFAHVALGIHYYLAKISTHSTGINSRSITDKNQIEILKDKAKQIWSKGSKFGSIYCKNILKTLK